MPGRHSHAKVGAHTNRVHAARTQAQLTQKQLAERLGMDYRTLGKLERGESRLRWEVAQRIARALRCSPFELVPEGEGLTDLQIEALRLIQQMTKKDAKRWLLQAQVFVAAEEEGGPTTDRAVAG